MSSGCSTCESPQREREWTMVDSLRVARGVGVLVAALALAGVPGRAPAQQSFNACYVPCVGAVYLIGLTGLPTACLGTSHVQVTLGGGALADGSVTAVKLADDAASLTKVSGGAMAASGGRIGIGGTGPVFGKLDILTASESAVRATSSDAGNIAAVLAVATAVSGNARGVSGISDAASGTGVEGSARALSGATRGVAGSVSSPGGVAVEGVNNATSGVGLGVLGVSSSTTGTAVQGSATATTGASRGVLGFAVSPSGIGVQGFVNATTGATVGVEGRVSSPGGTAGVFVGAAAGTIVRGQESGVVGDRFRVTSAGAVYADGSYNCGLTSACFNTGIGADVAERIDVTEPLEHGDVVEIDPQVPGHFRRARGAYNTRAAGIIATAPGITLANNDLSDNDTGERTDRRPLLTLVGRVPVKVT